MGSILDRTREHLGTSDRAVIRMRQRLLQAAHDVANGLQPPATDGALDFRRIYGAERILAQGEDWRMLGTDADPIFSVAAPPVTSA
jgi:hypothetical protein